MKTVPQSYCAYEDSTMFLLRFVTIGHVFGHFLIVVKAASMCGQGVKYYTNSICVSHAMPLDFIYCMLYHSHMSFTCYTTRICLSHSIPFSSVCRMLYQSDLSVTCYTNLICLSHAESLSSVYHM
jgi:hypothetical protein